ncbi:Tn3 family transposase [Cellvibrio sp. QJXJ]|uniref:Tn3 family transposase n=1 Tax=Cellvibrio sp. QJXJ TaxID=2964606 RepID=UPI0021C2CC73|nr:Tn3 family transposase [Cellvibrio sp. QJXJ]UUA74935.1 Tn3 family transposase [Cellvibrio sp. QJXJ]
MVSTDNRIEILTKSEINDLYAVPNLSEAEREEYFVLHGEETALYSPRNEPIINAYGILLLGYLKYKPVMLEISLATVKTDLAYIRKKYDIPLNLIKAKLSPTQKSRIYQSILKYGGYQQFDDKSADQLKKFVIQLAKQIVEPKEIFDGCTNYLSSANILIPGYSTLQKIISAGINHEERHLEKKILSKLTEHDIATLKNMAQSADGKPLITKIKNLPKSFQRKEMYSEIDVLNKLTDIFPLICSAVESLDLSPKNIDHFGHYVNLYSITRLRNLSTEKFALYLSCFIYRRYHQIIEILIEAFRYHVRKLETDARMQAQDKYVQEMESMAKKMERAGDLVRLWVDERFGGEDIAHCDVRKEAYEIISKNDIPTVSDFITKATTDVKKHRWQFYDEKSHVIKGLLRKIFLCLDFDSHDESAQAWLTQVNTAKTELLAHGTLHTFDARLIKPEFKPYLIDEVDGKNKINMIRAEMLLYIRIVARIEECKFFVDRSVSYKWYESDLVNAKDVPELVSLCNLPTIQKPIRELLDVKLAEFDRKRKAVGARIATGENQSVIFTEIDGKKKWSVKNVVKNGKEKQENYLNKLKQWHIGDVLAEVNIHTQFTKALTHRRLNKTVPDLNTIIACIVANGTRFGTHRMAKLCNIPYDVLVENEKNYLSSETLHNAIDRVSDAIGKLPIFKYYNIQEEVLHASYDGQRFESHFNTITTHFCRKYFGRGKGFSAVSINANHVPVNAQIMKPYSHESHYLFDVLHNNTSEIRPDVISTDNHGTNQFNFAILDCFGFSFAPRYARVGNELAKSFNLVNSEDSAEIVLTKPINRKLIEDNWDFIQQIMVSLDSLQSSQANIVRKMSRFKSKSNPFKALAEYDRLIKSIYLLDFIDDGTFRSYVHRALNRGESYHMLMRRIEEVNGKFRGNSPDEIANWYDCSRLIATCIIYFNARILSFMMQKFELENRLENLERVRCCSPVAWLHINFNGSYSFSFDGEQLDMYELIDEMLGN